MYNFNIVFKMYNLNHIIVIAFISNYNLSESYIWRAEIALLELLSHPKHTNKFYPIILVVPPLFMVISSLMRLEE